MEFTNRESKFEKEQKVRREALKKAKEVEKRKEAAQAAREKELEERRIAKREEEERKAAEERVLALEEECLTGGISFSAGSLTPYVIDGEDDKVILPESCIVDLSNLDVFGKGPILMQLSKADGTYTHSGVREFSAPADSIGLPRKIIFTLTGGTSVEDLMEDIDEEDETAHKTALTAALGLLSVKYVVMPKASYAKLRPLNNAFSSVKPVKAMLEENLRFHSTLSVGDLLTVWYRGVPHNLRVCEMKPKDYASLVDTDVTIDLDVSEEYMQKKYKGDKDSKVVPKVVAPASAGTAIDIGARLVENDTATGSGVVLGSRSSSSSSSSSSGGRGSSGEGIDVDQQHQQEGDGGDEADSKYMSLPTEPDNDESSSLTVRLKLSTGASITHRMRTSDEIGYLFEIAARQVEGGGDGGGVAKLRRSSITLTTRFPARTLTGTTDRSKTFADLGLAGGGQETFFVTTT